MLIDADSLEGPFNAFVIGNSLTQDSRFDIDVQRARDMNVGLTTDHYINAASSLRYIVDNPTSANNSAGFWPAALPSTARNFFSFQPWPRENNTIATELAAYMTLVDSALTSPSVDPLFFHYQTWPQQLSFGSNYQTYWNLPVVDADGTLVVQKKGFHDAFFDRILLQVPTARLIPVGDVLAEFDRLARLGSVPDGIATVQELFRDDLHMGDAGRFLASSTRLAVMLDRPPTSATTRPLYNQGQAGAPLTPDLADFMEQLVEDVVSADSRTGVTF